MAKGSSDLRSFPQATALKSIPASPTSFCFYTARASHIKETGIPSPEFFASPEWSVLLPEPGLTWPPVPPPVMSSLTSWCSSSLLHELSYRKIRSLLPALVVVLFVGCDDCRIVLFRLWPFWMTGDVKQHSNSPHHQNQRRSAVGNKREEAHPYAGIDEVATATLIIDCMPIITVMPAASSARKGSLVP